MTIRLAEPEAMALEGFCRRQLRWDDQMPARIVTTGTAIGMFTAPPMDVLVFVAVPVLPHDDHAPLDVTVSLQGWADMLRDRSNGDLDPASLARREVSVSATTGIAHLPPSEGWQVPMFALSGDLVPMVDAATAEYQARSVGFTPRGQETVADEIWGRATWGGLPLRALHAARQLGMLANDSSRVSATTCGPWKRLSTTRGQVFVHATGPTARLSLHVVR